MVSFSKVRVSNRSLPHEGSIPDQAPVDWHVLTVSPDIVKLASHVYVAVVTAP